MNTKRPKVYCAECVYFLESDKTKYPVCVATPKVQGNAIWRDMDVSGVLFAEVRNKNNSCKLYRPRSSWKAILDGRKKKNIVLGFFSHHPHADFTSLFSEGKKKETSAPKEDLQTKIQKSVEETVAIAVTEAVKPLLKRLKKQIYQEVPDSSLTTEGEPNASDEKAFSKTQRGARRELPPFVREGAPIEEPIRKGTTIQPRAGEEPDAISGPM